MKLYFSDYFEVSKDVIEKYGAFNISLVADLPLFIDPFLLFNSQKPQYKKLHDEMIQYLKFLKGKSENSSLSASLITYWYRFPEVEQTWLGFSTTSNKGSGLGKKFAFALYLNLHRIFHDFGEERITQGSHLEKLCLIGSGVGRDNISDFTTNLIHKFLLEYTQKFAKKYLAEKYRKEISVEKVKFNYETESWMSAVYELPYLNGDYVILTPKDILTKDETWINKQDFLENFDVIPNSISDDTLRAQVNNYFAKILHKDNTKKDKDNPTKKDKKEAAFHTLQEFPQIIDYYIRYKEENGEDAQNISSYKVTESEEIYIDQFRKLSETLAQQTNFYLSIGDTYAEALERVIFLKDIIENKDGYRIFFHKGKLITKEDDIQILFRLTWRATPSDINREVNNGRGPVDFKASRGRKDKTLVEFKLASNSQLKRNLEKQVEIYEVANDTKKSIKVILFFTYEEKKKVEKILEELKISNNPNIVLIDARSDNKPSASKA
ncbi:MAG: hypothetical protein ACR2MG_01260 [Pyrinomonadaceae bacterium]